MRAAGRTGFLPQPPMLSPKCYAANSESPLCIWAQECENPRPMQPCLMGKYLTIYRDNRNSTSTSREVSLVSGYLVLLLWSPIKGSPDQRKDVSRVLTSYLSCSW